MKEHAVISRVLPLVWVFVSPAIARAVEPVFEVRGWDLERFEPAYVSEMIDQANRAGVNTISLSHEIVMNAEEILHDWHRYKHLRRFCSKAHSYDMQVYLWNHQINNPPEELITRDADGVRWLDFDNDRLWTWLHDRYQRVVDRVPNLDGIILSLTESEWQIHRDAGEPEWLAICSNRVRSNMTPARRMAEVINTIRDSLHARNKRLIVRDFLRSPAEMRWFSEALESVPDDVWVYTKCVPNDWQYRYPPHPLLGKVGPHKQIMELDLFNETGGNRRIAMPAPYYYQRQIRLARDRGLIGVVPRIDDGFATNRGTPAEFNVYAYNRLIHDPDADVDAMWSTFFVPMYGKTAAPVAIECLEQCEELVCAVTYTLGFWTGSPCTDIDYTDRRLLLHSSALWSDDPKYKGIERLLIESGAKAIRRTVAEKREAERLATRCIQKLDQAQRDFDPQQFTQLRGYFEEAQQQARIGQVWSRAYFALRWYRNTKSTEAKAEAKAALAEGEAFVRGFASQAHGTRAVLSEYVRRMDNAEQQRFYTGRLPKFNTDFRRGVSVR